MNSEWEVVKRERERERCGSSAGARIRFSQIELMRAGGELLRVADSRSGAGNGSRGGW